MTFRWVRVPGHATCRISQCVAGPQSASPPFPCIDRVVHVGAIDGTRLGASDDIVVTERQMELEIVRTD